MSAQSDREYGHGMGLEPTARDWQIIEPAEASELIARYAALGELREIAWHSPRPFSSAAIVITESGPVFVKRHHSSVRDTEGLLEEHRFLQHLHSCGAAVSQIMADAHGRTAHSIGDWTYELQPLAQGTDLYRHAVSWTPFLHASHAREAGRALAQLHVSSAGYNAPARSPRPLVSGFSIFAHIDPSAQLAAYVEARPALLDYLKGRNWVSEIMAWLSPFHEKLAPLLPALPPLWTHNDLHASNMLWTGEGADAQVAAILDFGLADRTNAVYDLATTIERNTIEWLRMDEPGRSSIFHPDQMVALLDGYEAVRPLTAAERSALPFMLPLVHAEYALSEIDYFAGIVGSQENADLAYHEFLLGHARWFHSFEGRYVLEQLQSRWTSASF
ncbi:phosphotransferase [Paenibacillus pedocola]|uniref:phosphotransferase n=1 Tax=Paenibacillus pedocola TaxID=3242193 RepID=UPI00287778F0|nr:phosphotransferase [Paenibacillus typhae]